MGRPLPQPVPAVEDPALMLDVVAALLTQRILARVTAGGCPGLRASDGFVFQHLVPGPMSVSHLAQRLQVTPQGASKLVLDLESRGYVRRTTDAGDQRRRLVELTTLGRRAVTRARAERSTVAREFERVLGPEAGPAFVDALRTLMEHLGGFDALRSRRLRPPS